MDNIILTIKDADWIANIIRHQIEDLESAYKDALEEGNSRAETAIKLARTLFPDNKELKEQISELDNTRNNAIKKLNETYQTKLENYEHIIELLMTGSV